MDACLDSDVLIDYLRGLPAAHEWLSDNSSDSFIVPGIVAMELLMGCSSQRELKITQEFLNDFEIVWPEAHEFERAFNLTAKYRLRTGLSIPDYLVASVALERSLRLYTFNIKHYAAIAGLDVQMPYTRKRK